MAVRTRVQPIDRDISLMLAEDLSPQAQSAALARFANEQLREAQEINTRSLGRLPSHDTYVDGRPGAAPESVKPSGTIIFEFELVGDVIEWIQTMLIQHSPRLSGRYSKSHVLFADGAEVQFGALVPESRSYTFVNTQPYARKIERGLSAQAKSGVYEVVAVMASRRFGNVAKVRFAFVVPQFGAVHSWASKTSMKRRDRPNMKSGTRAEWLRRQPAIIVTV
ncbi:hypothetical protein FNL55_12675 [Tardiphaga sp. vice352]|uniref:hypothetical protein n=1 Tax=Tardiphaga sp. vice352 TaxID=2592816 RepID=UPI0011657F80|nr:hypothetical protein [Tardiphaga sp. vice352]QDM32093.1 hypothetical protein FNL55_12675 [Tardiphaga sp. vice352]